MTSDGPPTVISGGICDNGQFSIDIISRDAQSASSNGKLCNEGLSFIYKLFKESRFPERI